MKKMLYICRPQIGENLFATPCWELLSKKYEIYPLMYKRLVPIFKDYKYFKEIIIRDENSEHEIKKIFSNAHHRDEYCYAYHHDEDEKFMHDHPNLNYITSHGVNKDNVVFERIGSGWITRTRKYMLKLNLMTLEDTSKFDCTVRVPEYTPSIVSNDIVVYQGSKEFLRKLPTSIISKFVDIIPNAMYLVSQETADILCLKQKNIRHIITDQPVESNLNDIISLFKSKPKCMIGPDSGLTQLALGYKIPIVWLQSRIPINSVIDIQYENLYKVYTQKLLKCDQSCAGCRANIKNLHNSHGVFKIKSQTPWNILSCRKNPVPDCLDYNENEIQEILSLIS